MEVWYFIKSLPIWNHWGNKTKTILPEMSRCKARKGQHRDLPGLCHWFTSMISASHLLCISVLIDGGKPVFISFHRVVLSLTNHHLCKSLDERNHWSSKLLIYITYCTLKQSSYQVGINIPKPIGWIPFPTYIYNSHQVTCLRGRTTEYRWVWIHSQNIYLEPETLICFDLAFCQYCGCYAVSI